MLTIDAVRAALATVRDPEINRPITELGMVKDIRLLDGGKVRVDVWLTVVGCPLRTEIINRVTRAVAPLTGVTGVQVELDVMSEDQRKAMVATVRGTDESVVREIPFAQPGSLTRVLAVASGKGGVGKSSVTVNLAAAMAARGLRVGLLDADVYGFSVPRMLGVTGRPTQVDQNMIMPPQAGGVKVISIGMFIENNDPVTWRGPMLHRALQQFLADVYWGDLDVLLLDLPPGTGDIAISLGQLLPSAELVVVTTPQLAASEVAERAGSVAARIHQRVVGVVENMAYLACPHCSDRIDLFGSGGGAAVAGALSRLLGHDVPLLGSVPLEPLLRMGGDAGTPLVTSDPDNPASKELRRIAEVLTGRPRGLVGRMLSVTPRR
jgi:ATP-binding protein involved in chromosome partitioning